MYLRVTATWALESCLALEAYENFSHIHRKHMYLTDIFLLRAWILVNRLLMQICMHNSFKDESGDLKLRKYWKINNEN